ncbi:MAG: hypothetical protein H6817_05435 [Phycisphaerales bacterium]|nr:hypothetical protein [Phycisphaerales bacterium]
MKKILVVLLLVSGLACEMPSSSGDPTPTPSPSPSSDPTPTPTATPTPDPNSTPTPDPTATPDPDATPTPEPTATPDPQDVDTSGSSVVLGCPEDYVLVSVPDECDFDGSNEGCCPEGYSTVNDDCNCVADSGNGGPTPTPQPTPPPYTCPDGYIIVEVPEGCEEIDNTGTGYVCCAEDTPSIDLADCLCTEFIPPE